MWTGPPWVERRSVGRSSWRIPAPAVIHSVSPSPVTALPWLESRWAISRSRRWLTVSTLWRRRHGAPPASPGPFRLGQAGSKNTNRSAAARRRTSGNGREIPQAALFGLLAGRHHQLERPGDARDRARPDEAWQDDRVVDDDGGHLVLRPVSSLKLQPTLGRTT